MGCVSGGEDQDAGTMYPTISGKSERQPGEHRTLQCKSLGRSGAARTCADAAMSTHKTLYFLLGAQFVLPGPNKVTPNRPISATCGSTLTTDKKNTAAVTRADDDWGMIETTATAHHIDPALLAAIGVRESGFMNVPQAGGGPGMSVFQITMGPGVTQAQASNVSWAANYATNLLADNMQTLADEYPTLTAAQLLQATAASYNFGVRNIT